MSHTTAIVFAPDGQALPDSIVSVGGLETLYLDANPLSTLGPGIERLTGLKALGIAKTKIGTAEQQRVATALPRCRILTQ